MALSKRLRAYVALERQMLALDEDDDPLADRIRDLMDPIWYGLTDGDHAWLDTRPQGEDRLPARRPPRPAKRAANAIRAYRARDRLLLEAELAGTQGFAGVAVLAPKPPSTRDPDWRAGQ